ncbi:MAG: apolipoprotein N-acyltransferase [Clostridia bacterium]|nr:apolipoprotein N-acyltransferase [Clostridia bacterium]
MKRLFALLSRYPRITTYSLLGLSAVLTGLTLIFPVLWWLEWISMIPLGVALLSLASDKTVKLSRLYGLGVFYFFCYGLVCFHWFIHLYPLSFIDGMTPPAALAVVLAGSVGLSFFQSLFGGLVFLFAGLLFRSDLAARHPFLRPFTAAALWAIYEWSQTFGWFGVPWGRLPLGQLGFLPGAQTASLFGSYGITFVLIAVNFCLAYAIRYRENIKLRVPLLCVTAMLVFQYGAGAILQNIHGKPCGEITVSVIQGNVASGEKWTSDSREKIFTVYENETRMAAEEGAEIVIFPETALPYSLENGRYARLFCQTLAADCGVTVLAGGYTSGENGEEYNSLVCFLPDGSVHETVYAKRHLVPFGEYVPLQALIAAVIPPLAELNLSGLALTEGTDAAVYELEEGRLGALICFDSIYEELSLDSVRSGAQLLCIATNDSWFTDSAALRMHNGQARLRAIETGRTVVRSANTGISSVISSHGQILSQLDILTEGHLTATVTLYEHTTLYSAVGNLPILLITLLLCIWLGADTGHRLHAKHRERRAKKH